MRWLMTSGRIASYIWVAMFWTVALLSLGGFISFWRGGGPLTLLIMGCLHLALAWELRARKPLRFGAWTRRHRYPCRRRGAKPGATLASVTVALLLITFSLTMLVQAYVHGSRAQRVQARRTVALGAAQEQIETARARGYAALPGIGEHTVAIPAHESLRGTMRVQAAPVPGSRQVTVTVRWPRDERMPAGKVSLSTVISARGVGG